MTALTTAQPIGTIDTEYLPYNNRGRGPHGEKVVDHVLAGKRAKKVIDDLKASAQYCHISQAHSRLAIRFGDEKPIVFILDSHLFRNLLQSWGMYDDDGLQSRHIIELAGVILNWINHPDARDPYTNQPYSEEYRECLRNQFGENHQIICDITAVEPVSDFFADIEKKNVANPNEPADDGDIEDFDAPPGMTRAEAAKKPEPLFWNDEHREEMADADYEDDEEDYEEDDYEDDYEDDFEETDY